MLRKTLGALAVLFAVAVFAAYQLGHGVGGRRQDGGEIVHEARPAEEVRGRARQLARAAAALDVADRESHEQPQPPKQILFGDLHVHTTFSLDAFMLSLPLAQGDGVHPPADACDFARFCSGLDFWSINDHAEGLTPHQWAETVESIRQCNAAAGDPSSPDLVSFLGWEWTQIGARRADHYGHKNVVLRDIGEDEVPARPIASRRELFPPGSGARSLGPLLRLAMIAGAPGGGGRQPYLDLARFLEDRSQTAPCTTDAPPDASRCQESASTPRQLFERLDAWGHRYLVIPHGNTWGIYTPPGSSWDRQLAENPDPERTEPLIEVFSGHGSIEEYRSWRALEFDADGRPRCPGPVPSYTPECHRAGEIIRARCLEAGESRSECEARAAEARQNHADARIAGHLTVPGATTEDWLDAGQCTDCYLPAYHYRPGGSSQYALAIRSFDGTNRPKRFRFGFLASSDIHSGRPGAGYKEFDRLAMTDTRLARIVPPIFGAVEREARSRALPDSAQSGAAQTGAAQTPDFERTSSFFGTAGLVAVHASGRDRGAIWDGLSRREVYGTSGDRILLWFDWLGDGGPGGDGSLPMGSEVFSAGTPRFRVRAAGAFVQQPGCPESAEGALGSDEIGRLCRGDCYHPSDVRRRITRIEVVRIRPQSRPGEPVAGLIEDPWRVLPCSPDPAGCRVEFGDPEFAAAARDATYYVRAIQEPTPTINAGGLRCTRDADGRCLSSDPCYADERSEGDCTALAEERAWSSPIFVTHAASATGSQH